MHHVRRPFQHESGQRDMPSALQSIRFGSRFDRNLDAVNLPQCFAEHRVWRPLQPESGQGESAQCVAECHVRRPFRPGSGLCVARRLSAFAAMLPGGRPDGLRPSRRRPVRALRGSVALSFRSHAFWLAPGRPRAFAASACAAPAWLGGFLLSQPCFLVGARTASGLRGVGLCGPCVARWLSAFAAMLSGWRPDGLGPSRRRPVRPLRGSEAFCFRSRASWWTPGRPQAFAASACAVPAWLGGSQLSQPCFLVGARTASILRGVGLKDS